MLRPDLLAKIDSTVRPLLARHLPPKAVVSLYSRTRPTFLHTFATSQIAQPVLPPAPLSRTLWGLEFRSPLGNAAGMFKNGEAYAVVAAQGAGFYLAGTTTWNARSGNAKDGVVLPFAPYPRSGAASNWLGLPNEGDQAVAARLATLQKVPGCPLGASVMGSPDYQEAERVAHLIEGMFAYAKAGVDFLEINESCPNTAHGQPQHDGLADRLGRIATSFLTKRERTLPVVVKFSNDTELAQVPALVSLLIDLGFDGINFGNSSTAYAQHLQRIDHGERKLYSYFTETFGGGLTGRPLKFNSLELVRQAVAEVARRNSGREFHVVRTGGVEDAKDLSASLAAGASLVQWYTGYFEAFAARGHQLYAALYSSFAKIP